MEAELEKLFVDFDLFYPSKNTGFTIWGKQGTALLNNIKATVNARLEQEGYVQISLPSVFNKSYFERHIGSETKNSLLVDVIYKNEDNLVLKPFSELIYTDFLTRNILCNKKSKIYEKVFQWGLCFLNEIHPNLCLNGNEITKCEIFSIHDEYAAAEVDWRALNRLMQKICLEDFNVFPLFGYRPGISAFPSSLDTFAAEIGFGLGEFQTLLVSHVMDKSFLGKNGFTELENSFLSSACFSQKMIAACVLHQRDRYGFRYSTKLAPVLGIIACKQPIERNLLGERVRLIQKVDGWESTALNEEMVNQGAVWLIEEIDTMQGTSQWNIFKRGNMEDPPMVVNSLDEALRITKDYLQQYDRILLEESKNKVLSSMVTVNNYEQINDLQTINIEIKPNIFVPCCCNSCMDKMVEKIQWIPKLIYKDSPKKCIQCGESTEQRIMLEYSEMYTSFYVPKERSK